MISASARGAARMLRPLGSGSLDHPDSAQAVTPLVSTVAAMLVVVEKHHAAAMPSMRDRVFLLFILQVSNRPFGSRQQRVDRGR